MFDPSITHTFAKDGLCGIFFPDNENSLSIRGAVRDGNPTFTMEELLYTGNQPFQLYPKLVPLAVQFLWYVVSKLPLS